MPALHLTKADFHPAAAVGANHADAAADAVSFAYPILILYSSCMLSILISCYNSFRDITRQVGGGNHNLISVKAVV
jgi:hypothetical protein